MDAPPWRSASRVTTPSIQYRLPKPASQAALVLSPSTSKPMMDLRTCKGAIHPGWHDDGQREAEAQARPQQCTSGQTGQPGKISLHLHLHGKRRRIVCASRGYTCAKAKRGGTVASMPSTGQKQRCAHLSSQEAASMRGAAEKHMEATHSHGSRVAHAIGHRPSLGGAQV